MLKGDLKSLESTAQSVVDNLDEVGSNIGKAVDKVQTNVAISDDAYKAIDDALWAKQDELQELLQQRYLKISKKILLDQWHSRKHSI